MRRLLLPATIGHDNGGDGGGGGDDDVGGGGGEGGGGALTAAPEQSRNTLEISLVRESRITDCSVFFAFLDLLPGTAWPCWRSTALKTVPAKRGGAGP